MTKSCVLVLTSHDVVYRWMRGSYIEKADVIIFFLLFPVYFSRRLAVMWREAHGGGGESLGIQLYQYQ